MVETSDGHAQTPPGESGDSERLAKVIPFRPRKSNQAPGDDQALDKTREYDLLTSGQKVAFLIDIYLRHPAYALTDRALEKFTEDDDVIVLRQTMSMESFEDEIYKTRLEDPIFALLDGFLLTTKGIKDADVKLRREAALSLLNFRHIEFDNNYLSDQSMWRELMIKFKIISPPPDNDGYKWYNLVMDAKHVQPKL